MPRRRRVRRRSGDPQTDAHRHGASPRGLQSLVLGAKIRSILEGRFNVAFEDIREVALPALRHRVILNFEADAEGITATRLAAILLTVLPEAARGFAEYRMLGFGLVMILMMIWRPQGLLPATRVHVELPR